MKLINVEDLLENEKLVVPLYNQYGQILVNSHIPLTHSMITRIKKHGVNRVFVLSDFGNDTLQECFSPEQRQIAVVEIQNTFQTVRKDVQKYVQAEARLSIENLEEVLDHILETVLNDDNFLNVLSEMYVFDEYTFTHSLHCALYTLTIGKQLGLSDEELKQLGFGALLHDIGKMVIPQDIIQKPAHLTDEEYRMIKRHPLFGYSILQTIESVHPAVLRCALEHHERLDGSGYPHGKESHEIHTFSKILAVVDVYDALTSKRVYRENTMLPFEALKIIERDIDTKFDRHVFQLFKQSIVLYPNGTVLRFSDRRRGIVFAQNKVDSSRPIVRIVEENGQIIKMSYIMDLVKHPNVQIVEVSTFQHA
ncbi:MAG: HD-GYP domain-containing protein [Bacilli bacterium]